MNNRNVDAFLPQQVHTWSKLLGAGDGSREDLKKHTRRLKNILENARVHFTEAVSERQGRNNADIVLYLVAFLFCPFHIILAHSK